MASWKPSGTWKTPLQTPNSDDSSFPGLKPAGPERTGKLEYEELQQDELLALEAIYGEDFVKHTEGQSAWKVAATRTPRCPCSATYMTHAHVS